MTVAIGWDFVGVMLIGPGVLKRFTDGRSMRACGAGIVAGRLGVCWSFGEL